MHGSYLLLSVSISTTYMYGLSTRTGITSWIVDLKGISVLCFAI